MAITATTLRDRFRRDVDDELPSAADDSAALFSNDDVLDYLNEALARFVHDTRYLNDVLQLTVVANDRRVKLPDRFISVRGDQAYLKTYGTYITENSFIGMQETVEDDYGSSITGGALGASEEGRPRYFSLDFEEDYLYLFPIPDADDTLELEAYVEAKWLDSIDSRLPISNPRHAMMLLDGMKELAYNKLDAETFDADLSARFGARFQRNIIAAAGERQRRRRKPGPIVYGGL